MTLDFIIMVDIFVENCMAWKQIELEISNKILPVRGILIIRIELNLMKIFFLTCLDD